MRNNWLRAYQGRVLHNFVNGDTTACGKKLTPHRQWFNHVGNYPKCKKCQRVVDEAVRIFLKDFLKRHGNDK